MKLRADRRQRFLTNAAHQSKLKMECLEDYHKKKQPVFNNFNECFSSLQSVVRGESKEHPLDDPDPAEETKEGEEDRLERMLL